MLEIATFAAGCFWGIEATFRKYKGVLDAAVGYMGGHTLNPTYEDVCTGKTNHAEVVHIQFDPNVITFAELLNIFWSCHNPTTLNRQGFDIGTQYRSAIFYHNESQKQQALEAKAKLDAAKAYPKPIVTEITMASTFYRGEEYHQQYLAKRGRDVCH